MFTANRCTINIQENKAAAGLESQKYDLKLNVDKNCGQFSLPAHMTACEHMIHRRDGFNNNNSKWYSHEGTFN